MLQVARLQFKAGAVQDSKKTILDLLKHGTREQVRLGAAKFVLEHQRELYELLEGSTVNVKGLSVPPVLQVQIVPVTPQPAPTITDSSNTGP